MSKSNSPSSIYQRVKLLMLRRLLGGSKGQSNSEISLICSLSKRIFTSPFKKKRGRIRPRRRKTMPRSA
jgi:hypothetical protein